MEPKLHIEIWSDIVCPWCYIGKRRFEAGLAQFAHRDRVEVTWRSFELDPRAPQVAPGKLDDRLAAKLGISASRAAAMNAQVTALAAAEGLDYQLDRAQPGNTFDAHRLLHFAAAHGLQAAAKERLMRAYFTEGRALGDPDTLAALGAELGLSADDVRAMLDSTAFADEVRADELRAKRLGISGVPFYVLNDTYGVSGAQPADTFLSVLEQVWAETRGLPEGALTTGS